MNRLEVLIISAFSFPAAVLTTIAWLTRRKKRRVLVVATIGGVLAVLVVFGVAMRRTPPPGTWPERLMAGLFWAVPVIVETLIICVAEFCRVHRLLALALAIIFGFLSFVGNFVAMLQIF